MQGYFDIDEIMGKLKDERTVKVPFKWLYDIRQYDKCMDGCYMKMIDILRHYMIRMEIHSVHI